MKINEFVQFLSRIEDVKYNRDVSICMRDMEEIIDDCIKDEDMRVELRMVLDDVWLDNCIYKYRVFESIKLYCEENEEQDLDITVLVNKIKHIHENDYIFYIDHITGMIYSFTSELYKKINEEVIYKIENYIRYETNLVEGDDFR